MPRAVSVSIGSSKRDWKTEVTLGGKDVTMERIGTDGDMKRAAELFGELDGAVDAFGLGGTELGLMVDGKWYPMHSVQSIRRYIQKTPLVDGTGLKLTLEKMAVDICDNTFPKEKKDRKVLITTAVDRWGLVQGFRQRNYQTVYGDLLFSLDVPIPLRKISSVKMMACLLLPIVGRLPFHWFYPVGKEQEQRKPKYCKYFEWADVITGDCHYITRYMPCDLSGKIILTNTTTPRDRDLFKQAGVRRLITSTPIINGRSFGTNLMEATILAAAGFKEQVDYAKSGKYLEMIQNLISDFGVKPQVMELNP